MLLEVNGLKLGVAAGACQILGLFECVLNSAEDFNGPVRVVELLLVIGVGRSVNVCLSCSLASVILGFELLILFLFRDDYLLKLAHLSLQKLSILRLVRLGRFLCS